MERKFRSKGDRKSTEVEEMLSRTFEEAIMTHLYPRSEVNIFVQILQADGGTYVPCLQPAKFYIYCNSERISLSLSRARALSFSHWSPQPPFSSHHRTPRGDPPTAVTLPFLPPSLAIACR